MTLSGGLLLGGVVFIVFIYIYKLYKGLRCFGVCLGVSFGLLVCCCLGVCLLVLVARGFGLWALPGFGVGWCRV